MAGGRTVRKRDDEREAEAPRREPAPAHDPAKALLALQQGAGNQAVSRMIQRRVTVANVQLTPRQVPPVPQSFIDRFEPYVVDQARQLAADWVRDGVDRHAFDAPEHLYRKIFGRLVNAGSGPVEATKHEAWAQLKRAVDTPGQVTEVPWSKFNADEAGKLLAELEACDVQRSSNQETTAFHGNAHGKLPKRVQAPGGQPLANLPKHEQQNHTPYVEFLIPGHKRETGIERGILDREAGLIYITAHYDVGSFAWLAGVPGALVSNWSKKATSYAREFRA